MSFITGLFFIHLGWFVHTSDWQASSWRNGTSTQLCWVLPGTVWLLRLQHPRRTDQWQTRSTPHDQLTNSDSTSHDLSRVKEYIPFRADSIQIDHLARSFLMLNQNKHVSTYELERIFFWWNIYNILYMTV